MTVRFLPLTPAPLSNTNTEYVLGTRVLLKSIQMSGTKHDILVLVSPNVRQESRDLFHQAGAKVIEVVSVINFNLNVSAKLILPCR